MDATNKTVLLSIRAKLGRERSGNNWRGCGVQKMQRTCVDIRPDEGASRA